MALNLLIVMFFTISIPLIVDDTTAGVAFNILSVCKALYKLSSFYEFVVCMISIEGKQ